MWQYVYILLVVPQGIYMVDNSDDTTEDTTDEEIAQFTAVVQNISKVNDVLEKLIANYEHLKIIYNSNETEDSTSDISDDDVSIDTDTDNSKQKETPQVQITSTDITPSENNDKDGEESKGKDYNKNYETNIRARTRQKHIQYISNKLPSKPKKAYLQPQIDHSHKIERSRSNPGQLNKKESTQIYKDENYEVLVPSSKAKKSEIVFIDSHKKHKVVELQPKIVIRSKAKTRSKTYANYSNHHTTTLDYDNEVKTIKKQRDNSKKGVHVQYTINSGDSSKKPSILSRNRVNKTKQGVNVNHDIERKNNSSETSNTDAKTYEDISESGIKEDDILIFTEQFKTDVLRTAYDQACLKLVVRKCHKACTGALMDVCKHFRCKKSLKSRFLLYEKRRCIKEFGAVEPNVTQSEPLSITPFDDFRSNNRKENDPNDAYLSAACFNTIAKGKKKASNLRANTTIAQTGIDKQVNILRDRLEEACSKISARKCRTACNDAHTKACVDITCVSDMKIKFKKHCSRSCDKTFDLDDSGSSSSSGSSDSSD